MNDDDDPAPKSEPWHLDRRVPIALILAIVLQTAGVVFWAAKIDTRVAQLESGTPSVQANADRLTRVEEKIEGQHALLERIDRRLERMEERRR